jgi:GTP pyrophosphokinase
MTNDRDDPPPPHPVPPQPWLYGPRLVSATRVALEMHATQVRKGTEVPYVSHLLGTCSIVLDHGANEDQAIAALLHDAIEDVHFAAGAREAVAAFGPEVLRIVEACTDADTHPKPPWMARKTAYIEHLAHADAPVLLVSAADKLHNARSMVADHRRVGAALWSRFNATRAETLGNYRALVTAFRANPAHPAALVDELDRTVTELERLAATEDGVPT